MKNEAPDHGGLHKLGTLIDNIEVAMLTSRAPDGSLVSRPLQTLKLDANGDIIFFTAASSHKVAELTEDASVNLAYAHPSDQRYVSVSGRARMDRDPELIDELWSPVQKVFFPRGKEDPDLMVLRVRVHQASYWESAGNFVERALDLARGMLGNSPGDIGEHGHIDV